MAKKATRKKSTTTKKDANIKEVVTSSEKSEKKVALTPATVDSAEIIEKAVKATKTTAKPTPKSEGAYPGDDKTPEATPSKYDVLLGRYCKTVSEYNNDISPRRPIGDFIALMNYVTKSYDFQVYNDMLTFFVLEYDGLVGTHTALNGIETITDLRLKTRIMTAFTVFRGLAIQKSTGKRHTFSIGAVRQILPNEKFANWVNIVANS